MTRTVTGVDVGRYSSEFLRGFWKGNTFHVTGFAVHTHEGGDLARAWAASAPNFKPTEARVGLTGRDVNIRYTRVPRLPDWQLRKLMRFEVEEIGGQSGSEVASDFNLLPALPEIEDEDVCLLAMARESLLAEHARGLAARGGRLDAFAPCALGLYNAWTRFGVIEDETVLIANVGHENTDVILVRGPDLLFARNLSGGSQLFDEALAERFGVSPAKARELKHQLATLRPGASSANATQEKASRSLLGAAGQILSLLQSTVLFCKSQIRVANLRVDRVLLCGGGAALDGLCEYLGNGMNVPVEPFDPFRVVDTSALDAESAAALDRSRLESVVALGLATMASDPDAYSIEILPAAVRARREFLGGTLFAIAAGVLAAGFLGYVGWQTSSRLADVDGQLATLDGQYRRAVGTDRQTRELLDRNAELAATASELQAVAGSGEQLARALEHLEARLPEGFWIEKLTSLRRADEALGVARDAERPILHLEGRAREGTESIATLLDGFVSGLREAFPEAAFVYAPSPSGDRFTLDFTFFAPVPEPRPVPGAAPDGGGGEEG